VDLTGSLQNMTQLFNCRFLLIVCCLAMLSSCAGTPPRLHIPKQMPPKLVLQRPPQVALVLGSGGAKGYAHLGVLQVLQQAGIPIDLVVGSSAGSVVAAFFADNGSASEAHTNMLRAGFWDFADMGNTPSLQGPIVGYRFEKYLLKHMRSRWFKELKVPLVVTTTDLLTGNTFAISSGPIAPAIAASAAVPGAVRPIHLYGRTLVDGGMADPVPVNLARSFKAKVVIAVDVSEELPPSLPATAYGIYSRAFTISWLQLAKFSYQNANVVIRPRVGETGTFAIDKKLEMVQQGVRAAQLALPEILRQLAKHHIKLMQEHH